MHSRSGFTLVELMISIVILTLISTATVFALRTTRANDELLTAARLLSGDIRNIQARALAARNVLQCSTADGLPRICELENTSVLPCVDACAPLPPARFGLALSTNDYGYELFADVRTADGRFSNDEELLLRRDLNPLAGKKVGIAELITENGNEDDAVIVVGRQNGTMRIDPCNDLGFPACTPTEPRTLGIVLRHTESGKELTIDVNAVTGRVSQP